MTDGILCILFLVFYIFGRSVSKIAHSNKDQLNVLVMAGIGYTTYESEFKNKVIAQIKSMNKKYEFDLGIILGDTISRTTIDSEIPSRLKEVFSREFPYEDFEFDFLTILGNVDHRSNVYMQVAYHIVVDHRFYLPGRYYVYDIFLNDATLIRFIGIDSTPLLFESRLNNNGSRDIIQEKNLCEFLFNRQRAHYTFILSHQDIVPGFAPYMSLHHREFFNESHFQRITANINGHFPVFKHYQRSAVCSIPRITMGSISFGGLITGPIDQTIYCEKAGFGQLLVTKAYATLRYINEDGHRVGVVHFDPFQIKSILF